MKIAWLLVLLVIVCDCTGQTTLSWQEEMQSRFDEAVSSADKMEIASLLVIPGTDTTRAIVTYVPAWESVDREEIAALSRFVRIKLPPPSITWVEGKSRIAASVPGSYYSFSVTLKKKDSVLLSFYVLRGLISSDQLCGLSAIGVDRETLEPFYKRVIGRIEKQKANQSPEPTVMSVTPRADARVAPAATVAHL